MATEKEKERARKWYAENKDRMRLIKSQYQKERHHKLRDSVDFRMNQLVKGAKARSVKFNLPCDIDKEYVLNLWNLQNGVCSVSGRPFDLNKSDTYQNKDAPSLDKIIPELGYVKGNIRLVTWHVNAAILNFGLPAFLELCKQSVEYNRI